MSLTKLRLTLERTCVLPKEQLASFHVTVVAGCGLRQPHKQNSYLAYLA